MQPLTSLASGTSDPGEHVMASRWQSLTTEARWDATAFVGTGLLMLAGTFYS